MLAESLTGKSAPEFSNLRGWLNTSPLTMTGLRGKVVLLDLQLCELRSVAASHETAPQRIRRRHVRLDRGTYSRVRVRENTRERCRCSEEVWNRIPGRNRQRKFYMETVRKPVLATADFDRFEGHSSMGTCRRR